MSATMPYVDRRLAVFTLTLVGLGLVMVYGASSYEATLQGKSELSALVRQGVRASMAIAAGVVAMLVPYRVSCRLALVLLPVAMVLLAMTVVGGNLVREAHGIGRWLELFGVVLQPVELAKLGLALVLPHWIVRHPESTTQLRPFLVLLGAPSVVFLLLALQPNFGSALALGLMCGTIFWVAGVRLAFLAPLALGGAGVCWLGYLHVSKVHERVHAWLGVLLTEQHEHSAFAYQSYQALLGLGSGGLTGVGPGASTMKYRYLPAGETDFIFAILGEELGFVGAVLLVLLLGLWMARTMKIAHRSADHLAYLVALSVGAMIFSYAALNLAMVVALMPVAGLPLPFMSYGGSALVTNLVGVGVLLNVSRSARRSRRRPSDRWQGVPL